MSTRPILIRGGRLVDPATGTDALRDLLLRDGVVAAVEQPGQLAKIANATVIDATGLVVAPGLVDIHVHLREPGQSYKETIATGTAAAAAGGFTSVCCMPNTIPVNDTPEITRWMLAPERKAIVSVFPIGAATVGSMGEELTDYNALRDAGAVGVSDDGKPILGDEIMRQTLIAAAKANLPVIQHAEDTRLTGGCSMNAGPVAFRLGLRGMTIEAEARIVERDIQLIREIVASDQHLRPHLHVAHISTARALEAVKQARKEGLHVTCEVAPHHFTLTDEAIGDYDTHHKMAPPLRDEVNREAMINGLLDGSIDAIATDHAPHAAHEKQVEFERDRARPHAASAASQARHGTVPHHPPARAWPRAGAEPARPRCARNRCRSGCCALRSPDGLDLSSKGIAFEVEEHALRRLESSRPRGDDDSWRPDRLS